MAATSGSCLVQPATIGYSRPGVGLILAPGNAKAVFRFVESAAGGPDPPVEFHRRTLRPDHFAIILFLPVVLWVGWLFWQLGRWLARRLGRRWVAGALTFVLIAGLIAWSSPSARTSSTRSRCW